MTAASSRSHNNSNITIKKYQIVAVRDAWINIIMRRVIWLKDLKRNPTTVAGPLRNLTCFPLLRIAAGRIYSTNIIILSAAVKVNGLLHNGSFKLQNRLSEHAFSALRHFYRVKSHKRLLSRHDVDLIAFDVAESLICLI